MIFTFLFVARSRSADIDELIQQVHSLREEVTYLTDMLKLRQKSQIYSHRQQNGLFDWLFGSKGTHSAKGLPSGPSSGYVFTNRGAIAFGSSKGERSKPTKSLGSYMPIYSANAIPRVLLIPRPRFY
jgi:hypothetical protein